MEKQLDQDFGQDLAMARRVQQGFLNVPTPDVPGLKVVKRCVPAQTVGGDFYVLSSFFETVPKASAIPGVVQYSDRRDVVLDVIIGDVAGHGVSSALVMALSAGILTESIRHSKTPAQVLANANDRLAECISQSQVRYVTVGYARFYPQLGKLFWARAGHPPGVVLRQGTCIDLEGEGIFLGMFPGEVYGVQEFLLCRGDRVLLYTDGLTEARNPKGEMLTYSMFCQALIETSLLPLDAQLTAIYTFIEEFSISAIPVDDQTVVLVEVL